MKRGAPEHSRLTPPSSGSIGSNHGTPTAQQAPTPPQPQQQQQSQSEASSAAPKKRPRTAFTPEQIKRLETEFAKNKYLSVAKRMELSKSLNLTETQVRSRVIFWVTSGSNEHKLDASQSKCGLLIDQSAPNLPRVITISTHFTVVLSVFST